MIEDHAFGIRLAGWYMEGKGVTRELVFSPRQFLLKEAIQLLEKS